MGTRHIPKTLVPLEEFFRVLLFDEHIELRNRYLHVDVESGKVVLPQQVTNGVTNGVTNEDRALLALIAESPRIGYEELAKKLSVSRKTVAKRIKRLKEHGLLCRVGSNGNGFWQVVTSSSEISLRNSSVSVPQ